VRTLIVLIMAFGYASTMSTGPGTPELGRLFNYEPSLFAVQTLFFLSGWLCLRSLERHGSGFAMLASRARRILPMLAGVTAIVAFILYPLISADVGHALSTGELFAYFAQTVSCANPGQLMPGALDSAHYACLLQGAIWTFRWGALFYIGAALAWHLNLLRPVFIALAAFAAMIGYGMVHWISTQGGTDFLPVFNSIDTAFRLAYPFALGMAAFAWRGQISTNFTTRSALIVVPMAFAAVNFIVAPWTPVIEMFATLSLCMLTLGLVESRIKLFRWLENWPPLALPLFLLNWPLAQLWLYLRPDISQWSLVAITLATALAIAALCLPFLRTRNRPAAALA
jgi:peptidoglycan/LPS O-acetylase OafA/YrhL